jgi:hypothetical protein
MAHNLACLSGTVPILQSFSGMMEVLRKELVSSHLTASVEMHEVPKDINKDKQQTQRVADTRKSCRHLHGSSKFQVQNCHPVRDTCLCAAG